MKMIKALLKKYREPIVYVLVGLLTTVVNLVTFKLFNTVLGEEKYLISNAVAWFFAVCFSYLVNKIFVFESRSWKPSVAFKEITSFFSARVFSFFIEEGGLYFLVDILAFKDFAITVFGIDISGEMISKMIVGLVVIVINYIFSKFVVFRKKSVK